MADAAAAVAAAGDVEAKQVMEGGGKPRVLCLHGWRTSADILKFQVCNLRVESGTIQIYHICDVCDAAGYVVCFRVVPAGNHGA